ncbi:hypothetical protein RB653_009114 [Dictyostelium firmibasis]|uniref:Uncharacterized protein n=1 Tax=Dictyostelium firmibasis TaxID=79012 RepID=A0AAN7U1E6_9MYCE
MLNLTFYPSKCVGNEPKPLVLLFGFLGSNKKIMDKFYKIWENNNVFVYVPPLDFSTILLRFELKKLVKIIHKYYKDNENASKIIYLHGLSVGTCCIGTLISLLKSLENGKYSYVLPMIKSIILDSGMIIDEEEVQRGFSKTLKQKGAIGYLLSLSFPLFKSKWRNYCRNDFPHLLSDDYDWNYLIITGEYDEFFPNSSFLFVEMLKKSIKNENRLILQKSFDSKHALHFKNYPEEYKKSINDFIEI